MLPEGLLCVEDEGEDSDDQELAKPRKKKAMPAKKADATQVSSHIDLAMALRWRLQPG